MLLGLVGLPTYTWIKEKHSIFCGPVCYVVLTSVVDRYGVPTVFQHRSFNLSLVQPFGTSMMQTWDNNTAVPLVSRDSGCQEPEFGWELSSLGWTNTQMLNIHRRVVPRANKQSHGGGWWVFSTCRFGAFRSHGGPQQVIWTYIKLVSMRRGAAIWGTPIYYIYHLPWNSRIRIPSRIIDPTTLSLVICIK